MKKIGIGIFGLLCLGVIGVFLLLNETVTNPEKRVVSQDIVLDNSEINRVEDGIDNAPVSLPMDFPPENSQVNGDSTIIDSLAINSLASDDPGWTAELKQRDELVDKLNSKSFRTGAITHHLTFLDKQGFKNLSNLRYNEGGDWQAILNVITPLVPFVGNETLEFHSRNTILGEDTPTYEFRQKVNGIEIRGAKLRIRVDRMTGEIKEITSTLFSDRSLPSANFGADEAIKFASYYAQEKGLENLDASTPTLFYVRIPGKDEVRLIWRFGVGDRTVGVDAVNGKVISFDKIPTDKAKVNVCSTLPISMSSYPTCSAATSNSITIKKVFIGGSCDAGNPSCNDSYYKNILNGASATEDLITEIRPDYQLGELSITANALLVGDAGQYYPATGNIVLSRASQLSGALLLETIGHEIIHKFWDKARLPEGDIYSDAIEEGMSDVIGFYVKGRVLGSDPSYDSEVSNTTMTQAVFNPNADKHDNGEIVENLFYRVSAAEGVTQKDMEKLVIRTLFAIEDRGDSEGRGADDGKIDFSELGVALVAAGTSTTLKVKNAISTAIIGAKIRNQIPMTVTYTRDNGDVVEVDIGSILHVNPGYVINRKSAGNVYVPDLENLTKLIDSLIFESTINFVNGYSRDTQLELH